MAKRSLKASAKGRSKAKETFERRGLTQEYLAAEVGLSTRQSVWKFFSGRPIERHIFIDICFQLDLDWQEIADLPQVGTAQNSAPESKENFTLDELIKKLREHLYQPLQRQCRLLHSCLDVSKPLLLEQLYTSEKILPHLTNQRWLELEDLQNFSSVWQRHSLTPIKPKTLPALEAVAEHSKLIILGKPGAGKTTFLQYLALQCNEGKFKPDCLPVFIPLRHLAATVKGSKKLCLIDLIISQWRDVESYLEEFKKLLQAGKVLILLDGLDEIPHDFHDFFVKKIQQFSHDFYKNQIIITCRIAAQEYYFSGFTYVELADFDNSQVETFVKNWFRATASSSKTEGEAQAQQFLEQLERRENQPIRELVTTPILLNLVCSVFRERLAFPSKRSRLYQTGLDILLSRWDRARGIERDQTYCHLSLPEKITLLSQIAAINFEQEKFFFEKTEVLQIIANFLQSLPESDSDPETLWFNSEAVLRSIEVQHGLLVETAKDIYSFSHLTFQEYLTARRICVNAKPQTLKQLAANVSDIRWREVILLTANMLPQAKFFLQKMQEEVANIIAQEPKLQQFLNYINQKEKLISAPYHPAAIRAFYYSLIQHHDLNLTLSLDANFASDLSEEIALDLAFMRLLDISFALSRKQELKRILNFNFALDFEHIFPANNNLRQSFKKLKQQLPDPALGKEKLLSWWQTNGKIWEENLRNWLEKYRHLQTNWNFSSSQQELLRRYYDANLFLGECLQGDCQVTSDVKEEIKAALLLPICP